jgi:mannan endo-1,4-beta-mannosidase
MRSRLVMLLSVAIATQSGVSTAGRFTLVQRKPTPVHAMLQPVLGSYLGVYEPGSAASYRPIKDFAAAAGREPNIAEYFSGWAEQFDTSFANTLHAHGVIPFVEIDPTDASMSAIAAGDYDDYLRTYADAVADYGHPVVIGFAHEMNATWYPWGYKHVSPATFVAAWRHLVTVFRQEGADNVTWLWTVQADGKGTGPIEAWWPGAQYVTWVGVDGFYYRPSDTFDVVFGPTIAQIRTFSIKPVLLAETAVGPAAGQFTKIQDLFHGIVADKTLGLVWFDVGQHDGVFHQDWRIEDSQAAAFSFKLGVRDDLAPAVPIRT